MYEHSNRFPFLAGAYYLAHYVPRSQGGNDKLSSYLLQFKDNNQTAVKNWSDFAATSLRNSGVNFKIIVRALGSSEIFAHTGTPLDHLGGTIANDFGARYLPKHLSKARQNRSLKYLSAAEREQEMAGLYSFTNYGAVSGDNILLIDDVVTTGTTLKAIYTAITRSCPNVNVYFFSLAKTFDSWRDENYNPEIYSQMLGQKRSQTMSNSSAPVNYEESEPDWDQMERIFQDSSENYPEPTPPGPNLVKTENGWEPAKGYEWINDEANDLTVKKKEIIPPGPNLVKTENGWEPAKGYVWSKTNPSNKWEVIKPTPPGPNLVLNNGGWEPAKGYVWSKINPSNKWAVTKLLSHADLERMYSELSVEDSKSKCFIATATMGDCNHPDVLTLRQWRDLYLLKKSWGPRVVEFYYRTSPPIAKFISEKPILKKTVRHIFIKPFANYIKRNGSSQPSKQLRSN